MTTQKETLQPKDIVGYISAGDLKAITNMDSIIDIVGYSEAVFEEHPSFEYLSSESSDYILFNEVKPLLYPLSHLTKEIPFNGGTIVPMYEMLKKSELGFEKQSVKYKVNKNVYGVSYIDLEGFENGFTYSTDTRSFATYHLADKKLFITRNEFDLFQLLYQYKIDFLGLIDKGLAIDVSTLTVNPYL